MRTFALAWILAAVIFLALDAVWLSLMTPRLYQPIIGPLLRQPFDMWAAGFFYVVYISGMVALAISPAFDLKSVGAGAARGAMLGFVAYATYDLTNQATLQGWSWKITLADLAWGTSATGAASALTVLVLLKLLPGR
ncbi:DUF2177 family protein [Variovorax dokdonensis]|uniref:DUF2177 family protein n=1 Tax=Variovorax dokdonensis TaxID=344883 RepID=A0ABT7N976_9BURK|nr:DUF2177 family protein [Variovorax dokdonensis]MDM0044501.1 DUF2177 family protein [Variovorax dokdonensis]